eukprot:4634292-Prymnesium_polylepis.2
MSIEVAYAGLGKPTCSHSGPVPVCGAQAKGSSAQPGATLLAPVACEAAKSGVLYSLEANAVVAHCTGAGGGDGQRDPQSEQSVPKMQSAKLLPGPPSSHMLSSGYPQVLSQHEGGAAGGGVHRAPQSVQSVPMLQLLYSLPGPPSSQKESLVYKHASSQHVGGVGGGAAGGGGAADGGAHRLPQSAQSVPRVQSLYSLPCPPSSQLLSA